MLFIRRPDWRFLLLTGVLIAGVGNADSAPKLAESKQAKTAAHQASSGQPKAVETAVTGLRRESQRQAALALGTSQGLAARAKEINAILDRHGRLLDKAFNFAVLMEGNFVVPPIVRVAENVYAQDKADLLRISRQVIRIVRKARLAPTPLTWRRYLWLKPGKIYEPPSVLLPVNDEERERWDRWVADGYRQGVKQADAAFSVALNRLMRDYLGMLEYRRQVALGKIQPAIETASEQAVVIDEKQGVMRVLDGVRLLSKPARFAKPNHWEVIVIDD